MRKQTGNGLFGPIPGRRFKFPRTGADLTDKAVQSAHGPTGEGSSMYSKHFGPRQRPFPATPDSACYYPATGNERALARLVGGLANGEGLLLLTGPAGTGKTLLCHCLLERLPDCVGSAFLTNSHFR